MRQPSHMIHTVIITLPFQAQDIQIQNSLQLEGIGVSIRPDRKILITHALSVWLMAVLLPNQVRYWQMI